jgi:hypothetical protein
MGTCAARTSPPNHLGGGIGEGRACAPSLPPRLAGGELFRLEEDADQPREFIDRL